MSRFSGFWKYLGLGYYQAWVYIVVIGLALFDAADIAPLSATHLRMLFSGTIALAMVAAMFVEHFLDVLTRGRRVVAASGLVLSVGTVSLSLVPSSAVAVQLCVTGVLLTSLGSAVLTLAWIEYLSARGRDDRLDYVLLAYPFSAVLVFLTSLVPQPAVLVVSAVLPVFSSVTLTLCGEQEGKIEHGDFVDFKSVTTWRSSMTRVLVACLVASAAFGAVRTLPIVSGTMAGSLAIYGVVSLVFVAVFLLAHTTSDRSQLVTRVYRMCLPVLIVCYLLIPLAPDGARWIAVALLMSASYLFEMLVWLACPLVVVERGFSTLYIFGWGATAFHVGSFFGLLAGDWAGGVLSMDSAAMTISILSACALVAVMAYVFKEQGLAELITPEQAEGEGGDETDHFADVCAELAGEFGLSDREVQVLGLLAHGRSVPFIEQELCVSTSTAKTHVRHIYQKLGVHTRQDLLDLFE